MRTMLLILAITSLQAVAQEDRVTADLEFSLPKEVTQITIEVEEQPVTGLLPPTEDEVEAVGATETPQQDNSSP